MKSHLKSQTKVKEDMLVSNIILLLLSFIQILSATTEHCHTRTGRCYWIGASGNKYWNEARTACQSEGGDMAVMETEELHNYVTSGVITYIKTLSYILIARK